MTDETHHHEAAENVAQTMRETMSHLGGTEILQHPATVTLRTPFLVGMPSGRMTHDLSDYLRDALLIDKPMQRKGKATLKTLDSMIAWSNRHKDEDSVLYADNNRQAPSLTCIADYNKAGPETWTDDRGGDKARYGQHRGVYDFPLSREWKVWNKQSGIAMNKDELAEFIDDHAMDFINPTPALINPNKADNPAPWEERNMAIAEKIMGRFGQPHQLIQLAREFVVHEVSNLSVKTDRNTGTTSVQFQNEHKDEDGRPLQIPNLFLIAIPVFESGDLFRLTLRFSYVKRGDKLAFRLTIYDPEAAIDEAFTEAVAKAETQTGLHTFWGRPE